MGIESSPAVGVEIETALDCGGGVLGEAEGYEGDGCGGGRGWGGGGGGHCGMDGFVVEMLGGVWEMVGGVWEMVEVGFWGGKR